MSNQKLTLVELTTKRAYYLSKTEHLMMDFREYQKHPCETVDIMQIEYQFGFNLRLLKEVDLKIKSLIDLELREKTASLNDMANILLRANPAYELPEKHHSQFQQLDNPNTF